MARTVPPEEYRCEMTWLLKRECGEKCCRNVDPNNEIQPLGF